MEFTSSSGGVPLRDRARFGGFELDLHTGELQKGRSCTRLQAQPLRVLTVLLRRPGQLVSRNELSVEVWGSGDHIDCDRSITKAIQKIRDALNDSIDKPRYVETIPKLGYRFIAPVEFLDDGTSDPISALPPVETRTPTAEPEAAFDPVACVQPVTPPAEEELGAHLATLRLSERRLRVQRTLLIALLAGAALTILFLAFRGRPAEPAGIPVAFRFDPGSLARRLYGALAISADGRHIAYVTGGVDARLNIRDTWSLEPRALEGTKRAYKPFWSPDSRTIGFATEFELKRVSVHGGSVTTICHLPAGVYGGATWTPDGSTIIFSSGNPTILFRVPATGGTPVPLFSASHGSAQEVVVHPSVFPVSGGQLAVLFNVGSESDWRIAVQRLDGGPRQDLGRGWAPVYAPSGHIIYQTGQYEPGIWVLPFSAKTLRVSGSPLPVVSGGTEPVVSANGTLAYSVLAPAPAGVLVERDRSGGAVASVGQPGTMVGFPSWSPNGRFVAVRGLDQGISNIWLFPVQGGSRLRLTTQGQSDAPVWSPQSDSLAFRRDSGRAHEIVIQSLDQSRPPLSLSSPTVERPYDWSSDGRHLLFSSVTGDGRHDLRYLELANGAKAGAARPYIATKFDEILARFSPDGRFVVYCSDQSGDYEVYVADFPGASQSWQISSHGGLQPRWSRDGKEIFYVEGDTLMVASVSVRPRFSVSRPKLLFRNRNLASLSVENLRYDASPDGQRFVILERQNEQGDSTGHHICVISDWLAKLEETTRKTSQ